MNNISKLSFGIAWDFDGTIVKSQKEAHAPIEAQILNSLGIPITKEQICINYSGVKTREFFQILIKQYKIKADVDELVNSKWRLMIKLAQNKSWTFVPGVKKFIKEASEAGIQQVIGTASKKKYVEIILKRYKLYQYFSHIVSGDDVKRGKPDPETWLQCAKLLNLPPNKIIVIEDGIAGIKAAKKAGMPNILISSQKTRKANICIQNFKQLSISDLKTLKLTP